MRFSELTTLRTGGEIGDYVLATSEDDIIAAVSDADHQGIDVLVIAGGSNLVASDAGFPGRVVHIANTGIDSESDLCGGAYVKVAAGENFDAFIAHSIEQEWIGLEALSGIPGTVGATPIQNVGAYGQEVASVIASVRTWDRSEKSIQTFANADCRFSYRDSVFKKEPNRFVVLSVTFQFAIGARGNPIAYQQLADALGVNIGERVAAKTVREAVLALRRSKGMVLDENDHDTWSTGSFFLNPIVSSEVAAALPAEAPRFSMPDGSIKTSGAWLIHHAGFAPGYGNDRVSLSTKHSLAITNRGGASTAEILSLAREVRDQVQSRFGIRLEPEPLLVNCNL